MKITILNGDMSGKDSAFSTYLTLLKEKLSENSSVEVYTINDMDLNYCIGCWSCWWKTPGVCGLKDGAPKIFHSIINSDFVLFASPLMVGMTSSALKKIHDRLIVLIHPYMAVKNSEVHHQKRYDFYPDFGVLLSKEADTDDEDLAIVTELYNRFAINFYGENRFVNCIEDKTVEEVALEISNL